MGQRQRFTKTFKQEAVRLMKESGRSASALARELGIFPARGSTSGQNNSSGRAPRRSRGRAGAPARSRNCTASANRSHG